MFPFFCCHWREHIQVRVTPFYYLKRLIIGFPFSRCEVFLERAMMLVDCFANIFEHNRDQHPNGCGHGTPRLNT